MVFSIRNLHGVEINETTAQKNTNCIKIIKELERDNTENMNFYISKVVILHNKMLRHS